MNLIFQQIQLQAIKLAVYSGVMGCAVFLLLEQTRLTIKFGFNGMNDFKFTLLLFVFSTLLIIFPAIILGNILAVVFHNFMIKQELSKIKGAGIGSLLGAVAGIGLSLLAFILTDGRGSLTVYFWHAFEGTVISIFCGAWTGNKLTVYLQKMKALT